jgi:hypothetical protein
METQQFVHSPGLERSVENRAGCASTRQMLPERLHQGVDKRVEISIPLPHDFDLLNRVDDRRVMLAAETPANLGKRCVRQGFA